MIDRCKHCGHDVAIIKSRTHGYVHLRIGFNGKDVDNSEMYDDLVYRQPKYAYCEHCGKRAFKIEKEEV